ncbi:MAG: PAS domain-containing protein [Anaerolineaceae bacterium]|jgi:PAS domain S-box-containing protein|nr:PAS domain-containing protein [Anaerolineaceae bacterium]
MEDHNLTREELLEALAKAQAQVEILQRALLKDPTQELADSEERFRTLVNAVPDMLFRFDAEGHFVDYKGSERGTIVPPEVFLGKHYAEVLPPNVSALTKEALERGVAEKETQIFEYQLPNQAGELETLEARIITTETGEAVGLVRDVTEQRAAEALINKRAQELNTVAEVATAVTQQTDPLTLLKQVVDLTKERFGFYHAHVYQLNEAGDTLELVSGAGEIGDQMVAETRTISFDAEQSLVARAARTKEGVIVNDVMADPNFLPHPLLPETKAEMAVPMMAGETVIGVLDVQAAGTRRFDQDDAEVLTTLASQVAVALQNARQFEELQIARTQLDEALDLAQLAYWEFDITRGNFLFNDDYYRRILHTTAEEAGGHWMPAEKFAGEIVHPDDGAEVPLKIQEALQSTDPDYEGSAEARLKGGDGKWRNVVMRLRVSRDAQGIPIGLYGTNQDITELKQAEEALAENEARLQTLVNAVPDMIFRFDADGKIVDYKGAEGGTIVPPEVFLGKKYFEVLPPDVSALTKAALEKGAAEGEMQTFDYQLPNQNGGMDSLEARMVVNEAGEAVALIRDVTEQRAAVQALAENEARLQNLVDAVPDMIFRFDAAGTFVDYKGAEGGTIVPPEVFLGKHYAEVLPPNVAALTKEAIDKGIAEKEIQTFEYQLPNQAGELETLEARIITTDTGEAVGLIRDVTEQRADRALIDKRAQELNTVAEVATAVTQQTDPLTLLKQVVDLTKERFGFYHAHVYQLNEAGDTLELVSGAGEIGDQMVAETRTISFDAEQSLVARAARTKEGVIVNDVTADPNFLPHPLLPETKAEMAVPMMAGETVIGVLDVQAAGTRRFDQDDAEVLTTLASQVAVALQNAEQYAVIQQANKVIEQSPVIVYRRKIVDNMLDRILYVSENVAQYGYGAEDFTSGRVPFEQTIHPDDLQMVGETLIGNLQKNIDEYELEYRGLFPGDRLVWFSLRANIERDENGEAAFQAGTFIDITDIKKAQAALAENEARLQTLVNAVPDMIFRFDAAGKIVDYKGAEGGTIVPPEVFLGKKYFEVLPPDVSALTKAALEKGAAEGEMQTFDYQLPNQNGGMDSLEARMVVNEAGEAVALIRDVTEQRNVEAEREKLLQESRSMAEQEALINAISQKIQATTSVESALQVAIRELGDSLGAEKTSIRLGVDAAQRMRKK